MRKPALAAALVATAALAHATNPLTSKIFTADPAIFVDDDGQAYLSGRQDPARRADGAGTGREPVRSLQAMTV